LEFGLYSMLYMPRLSVRANIWVFNFGSYQKEDTFLENCFIPQYHHGITFSDLKSTLCKSFVFLKSLKNQSSRICNALSLRSKLISLCYQLHIQNI
jgi:hypothetical protein